MSRPSKWKDEYLTEIITKMSDGCFDYEICADWEISEETLSKWKEEKEGFKEAYEVGYAKCFKWWMTKGKERYLAESDKGFKYWQAIMNAKFKFSGLTQSTNTTNIQINALTYHNKSEAELLDMVQQRLSKLTLPVIDVTPTDTNNDSK